MAQVALPGKPQFHPMFAEEMVLKFGVISDAQSNVMFSSHATSDVAQYAMWARRPFEALLYTHDDPVVASAVRRHIEEDQREFTNRSFSFPL